MHVNKIINSFATSKANRQSFKNENQQTQTQNDNSSKIKTTSMIAITTSLLSTGLAIYAITKNKKINELKNEVSKLGELKNEISKLKKIAEKDKKSNIPTPNENNNQKEINELKRRILELEKENKIHKQSSQIKINTNKNVKKEIHKNLVQELQQNAQAKEKSMQKLFAQQPKQLLANNPIEKAPKKLEIDLNKIFKSEEKDFLDLNKLNNKPKQLLANNPISEKDFMNNLFPKQPKQLLANNPIEEAPKKLEIDLNKVFKSEEKDFLDLNKLNNKPKQLLANNPISEQDFMNNLFPQQPKQLLANNPTAKLVEEASPKAEKTIKLKPSILKLDKNSKKIYLDAIKKAETHKGINTEIKLIIKKEEGNSAFRYYTETNEDGLKINTKIKIKGKKAIISSYYSDRYMNKDIHKTNIYLNGIIKESESDKRRYLTETSYDNKGNKILTWQYNKSNGTCKKIDHLNKKNKITQGFENIFHKIFPEKYQNIENFLDAWNSTIKF